MSTGFGAGMGDGEGLGGQLARALPGAQARIWARASSRALEWALAWALARVPGAKSGGGPGKGMWDGIGVGMGASLGARVGPPRAQVKVGPSLGQGTGAGREADLQVAQGGSLASGQGGCAQSIHALAWWQGAFEDGAGVFAVEDDGQGLQGPSTAVVGSSPVAKAEVLASSDQTARASAAHPPPTASTTMGIKMIPSARHARFVSKWLHLNPS